VTPQEGFVPTGRQGKTGRCSLCGRHARLTNAHVPPRAAFNKGSFSWGGTTADSHLSYGRPKLGGSSRYAHCESCGAITSPWDDEYIRWAHIFAGNLLNSPEKGQREQIVGRLQDVRPGRFIRSAIAGMTALTPTLIDSHPELVRMVREGVPGKPPEDLRFLAAIVPDGSAAHLEGSHDAVVVRVPLGPENGRSISAHAPAISATIHYPPFSLLLADRSIATDLPHADCTEMLELGVDEVAEVSISLPVVALPRMEAPVPISLLRFSSARA
jgi:hypothetical protein